MKKYKKNRLIFYLILISFLLIKIFYLLYQKGVTWDSAVYIEMGKYIFSATKIGLWEPARPLIWPILLGFLWKIGFNPIIFGRLLELIFSLGCIYLTYLIGKRCFSENVALLSAFFLAFTPTFLFYSSSILTDVPSTFFALSTIYFFIKKRYFLTGLFLGLSFMTRFLQLLILIPIIFFLIFRKKKRTKNIINLFYGFLIILVPYLIFNTFLYKNPLYPFILQIFMTLYTGWTFNQSISFYFINLLKENFLVLFTIIGIIIILKQKDCKKITILSIFLLFLIFFNLIAHKEMRFILTFLPYMYLVMSYGIFRSFSVIKNNKSFFYLTATIVVIIWLIFEIIQIKIPIYKEHTEFSNYLKMDDVKDGIWVSNPIFIVSSNKKADELIYYPLYNSKRIDKLTNKIPTANHVLIDTCDILPCPPADKNCQNKTEDFLSYLKNNFKTIYYKKESDCEEFIFKR